MARHTHRFQEAAQAPAPSLQGGRVLVCPHCGARLRIIRRRRVPARAVRRVYAGASYQAYQPYQPVYRAQRNKTPTATNGKRRLPGGGVWWGVLGLLVLAMVIGEAFAANLPVQTLKGVAPSGVISFETDRGELAKFVTESTATTLVLNASNQITAVTVRGNKNTDGVIYVSVALKDPRGNTLASGREVLPQESGEFAITVGLEPSGIPYSAIETVSIDFVRGEEGK